ncbi:hypothetical protein EIP86_001677 [Pleurotus ostreatoroseus]|nr:hypothetical protein EIP86_001677 [Pleurotus ostreatoroseus]
MRLSLADALNHPWLLPLKGILDHLPAEREATASPRAAPVPLPLADVRPMSIDGLAATVSPQYAIPGAYPSSQPDRALQRRRKVLDDARETGHKMPEPSPEMIQRVEQMMRKESQTPEVSEPMAARGTKRKASAELSTVPMDQDSPAAGPSSKADAIVQEEAAPTPARNGRVRRGKAAAPAAPAAPRTRARTRGTPVDDEPAEATRRRSTRRK